MTTLTYKKSGVDIDAGNALVQRIKPIAQATHQPGVLSGLGGFAAPFELPLNDYKNPVLVSCTDGVGTKLKLATELQQHDSIGIDLVAMSVNDLIVGGATPLFFLDYYATGKLDVDTAATVIQGIANGCKQAGVSLIGGETAEMPGMYQPNDYDLAGFCVGIVEKDAMIDGSKVSAGDVLIGIGSSGPHSNGYSLIRHIIAANQVNLADELAGHSIRQLLMTPTKIYVTTILQLIANIEVHGIAHITGGGITENLPRILPDHCQAEVDCNAWEMPAIFKWLQQLGEIDLAEMLLTFNCGIGMIVCVQAEDAERTISQLTQSGEQAFAMGVIKEKRSESVIVYKGIAEN